MNQSISYLKQLKFDPKLNNSFVARYIENVRLVFLFMFLIIGIGTVSYLSLPQLLNPEIKIPLVIVSDVLPGASPEDIEALVTIPIEDAVNGIAKVKKITSSSQDSVSVTQIEFESGVDPEKARVDVQSAIDGVNLPEDANEPKVQKLDFQNQPVWIFTLTGQRDTASLNRVAKILDGKLKNLSNIDNVSINGLDEHEIQIIIKPGTISSFRVNPIQISQAIKTGLGTYPAGSINTDNNSFSLTIDPTILTLDDIRNSIVNLNGTILKIADIATVAERSKPDQNPTYFVTPKSQPERSITFN